MDTKKTDRTMILAIAAIIITLILSITVGLNISSINQQEHELAMAKAGMEQVYTGYNKVWRAIGTTVINQ